MLRIAQHGQQVKCPNCGHLVPMTYDEATKGFLCVRCWWPESRCG